MLTYPPLVKIGTKLPKDFVHMQIYHMILNCATYYFNLLYLVPKLFLKGKKLVFWLSIFCILVASAWLLMFVRNALDLEILIKDLPIRVIWDNPFFDFFGVFTTILMLGISTSIALTNRFTDEMKKREELKQEVLQAELSFLKAQIHPHFFFNTLNTIYSLSFIDANKSRKVLTTLSRMMRYLLYEADKTYVALEQELAFVQDYIEVMRLRINSSTQVDFNIGKQGGDLLIAPALYFHL